MTRPYDLSGMGAIVTGAAGGIGSAVARAFEDAGVAVAGIDREQADLTRADEVEHAVRAAVDRLDRLDIVFNGAGISGRRFGDGPVHECTEEAWDSVLDTNLKSVFLVCKHAVPALVEAGGGSIVNLSSVLALVGGDEDFATHAYAASKGGIVALSRAIAVTYAPQGVRCNALCPGLVRTAMSRRAQDDPCIAARLPELQPLAGGFLEPEDVAQAALFLASPASRFVTGAIIPVDAGWTAR
jgi:NAD(P)-dependent dehydrogenase (short-subunit alcohol dehydrogenase family)